MKLVEVDEAARDLEHLLDEIEAGEDVVLLKDGKPHMRLKRILSEDTNAA